MATLSHRSTIRQTIRSLLEHRQLLKYLVVSNLKLAHSNLVLGYLWWILTPLLWMAVYWLLVVGIFNRGEPNYPLFLLCAILPWRAFATTLGQSLTCISGQEGLLKQIAFPKTILPISVVLSNAINLVFGFLILFAFTFVYNINLTINILFLPLIAAIQLILTIGISFFVAIVAIYFADLKNLQQFILRIWLYLSPSLYSVERVPDYLHTWFMLNPFAPIFTNYRNVIMYGQAPDWGWLGVSFTMSVIILMLGLMLFLSQERRLTKVI